MPTIDTNASFAWFVYPFSFTPETCQDRFVAIERATWPGMKPAETVWQHDTFQRTHLLRHVADYLNPPNDKIATARLFALGTNALKSPNYGLGAQVSWSLVLPHEQIAFQIKEVQLSVFLVGVGFLMVRAEPESKHQEVWSSFLHFFRFISDQVTIQARRRVGLDKEEPFFPKPGGGLEPPHAQGVGHFDDIARGLLMTGKLQQDSEDWWQPAFAHDQTMPLAGLFIDSDQESQMSDLDRATLVYRTRNYFHASQEINPSPADLCLEGDPNLLCYAKDQWFAFSQNGCAFIAFDVLDTPFFRRQLPVHLQHDYFIVYQLVLHQRFTLQTLSEDVAEHWLLGGRERDEEWREVQFTRIQERFLSFTARGYFTQVMHQEHHHRAYRAMQHAFQIEQMYAEVRDEVQAMYQDLTLRRTDVSSACRTRRSGVWSGARSALARQPVSSLGRRSVWGALSSGLSVPASILVGVISAVVGFGVQWGARRVIERSAQNEGSPTPRLPE